ncbi:MAG: hypothetical protein GX829_05890, partial [Clostridium sp.]|nr:hypothetical protein [Clostridium sp.]
MRRSKRNKARLSVFLSALLMMSGAFQEVASDEDVCITPTPESPGVELVEEENNDVMVQPNVEDLSEEVAPVDDNLGQEDPAIDGDVASKNEDVDTLADMPNVDSKDAPVSDTVPVADKDVQTTTEVPKATPAKDEQPTVDSAKPVADDSQNSETMLDEQEENAFRSLDELNVDKGIKRIDLKSGWCYDWKNLDLDHKFDCNLDFNWGQFSKFDITKILPGFTKTLKFKKEWHGDANIYKFVVMELSVKDGNESKVVAYFPLLKSSDWEFEFMAPKGYLKGHKFHEFQYSVKEVPIHGYET